ncbi:unnamed protein product [Microthlaspi erraticum]|uniref:Uncharacterized protein n=1 Tax=Microthlaspi erraticum TaxID=1685480 RepID=A0A6D2I7P3_9BRAS|nr:unnamed protein product [Microthlaspi erraticum]CAA7045841.1 unnamed protein product [Microthlaspi erraticum]
MSEEKLIGHNYGVKSITKRKLIIEGDKKAVNTEIEILKDLSGVSNIVFDRSVNETSGTDEIMILNILKQATSKRKHQDLSFCCSDHTPRSKVR